MSMGIGKRYWVHVITHHSGDLKSCIKYMSEHPPRNKHQWYELRPLVDINGKIITCETYACDLVEGTK